MVCQACQSPAHCGIGISDCVQLSSDAVVVDNTLDADRLDDSADGKSLVRLCVPRRTFTWPSDSTVPKAEGPPDEKKREIQPGNLYFQVFLLRLLFRPAFLDRIRPGLDPRFPSRRDSTVHRPFLVQFLSLWPVLWLAERNQPSQTHCLRKAFDGIPTVEVIVTVLSVIDSSAQADERSANRGGNISFGRRACGRFRQEGFCAYASIRE